MELIDYAQEQGVNFIDMALSYPQPMDHYGVALKGRRDKFHLQMHLGITFASGEYARDYSLESVKRSFETQLEKTGSDYADVAVFHCVDTEKDYNRLMDEGVFDYAIQMKRAGVISNLGFASHTADIANQYLSTGEIDAFMFSINAPYDMDPAAHDPYGTDKERRDGITVSQDRQKLYQLCASRGIGITVMKAYGGGKLLDAKTSPLGRAMTIPQCLKYALDRPAVASCVVGVRGKADLEVAMTLYAVSDAELDYSFISDIQPKEMMGSCVYCNHCMPCPVGIDIGMTHKVLDLYLAGDEMAREHYMGMAKKAIDCVQCGICEGRCPFKVAVKGRIRQAAEVFGA